MSLLCSDPIRRFFASGNKQFNSFGLCFASDLGKSREVFSSLVGRKVGEVGHPPPLIVNGGAILGHGSGAAVVSRAA